MNKLTIPAILAATVLVAGIFAFIPVEQASTVHTSGTITIENDADIDAILADTATQGTIVAIDIVDEAFIDIVGNGPVIFTLTDVGNFPAGQHYTASFVLSLQDNTDTDNNAVAPTVEVQVWDGDQWVDVQATVPTPDDGLEESTSIEVAGEVTGASGTLRFVVDEDTGDTEALLDVQGTIELR